MDLNELYKWRDIFLTDGKLVELRVLTSGGKQTFSGYFYDIDVAVPMLQQLEQDPRHNFYFTVNEPKQACSSRVQFNSFQLNPKTTEKVDIAHRWWIPIDLDCERPADVASSNEEKEFAHRKAVQVYNFFKEIGWPEPVVNDSSSGYHLYIPCDLDNEKAGDRSEVAVKGFLAALQTMFGDEYVKVDQKPCDSCRIMRLPGFYGRKGLNTEERPHRLAKVLKAPKEITHRVTIDEVEAFVAKYTPKEEPKPQPQYQNRVGERFDVERFMTEHGIRVHNKSTMADGTTKYVLEECVFNPDHKHPDAAIFVKANGAISYSCFHDSCSDKTWRDVRLLFEPHAYDHEQRPLPTPQYQPRPIPQKSRYEFKDENPELGKKWLCTKDVKKIDLTKLEMIHTGYTSLDRAIRGLILGEVSIVSGSNSSGKSSWLNCLILNAREQGYKTSLWSGELTTEIEVAWLQMAAAGSSCLPSKFNEGYYVPNKVCEEIDMWLYDMFYLYNNKYGNKWEQIFKDMEEVVKAGAKLLILDNLFSLDIDLFEGDKNNKQKQLIQQICAFAKKNMVHIILVAHPRKSMSFIRKEDISGTSDVPNAVDNIFIIHRNNNDFQKRAIEFFGQSVFDQKNLYQYGNIIEVCKCRMFGNAVDELCGMYYDIGSRQFLNEPNQLFNYSWKQKVEQNPLDVDGINDFEYSHDMTEIPY